MDGFEVLAERGFVKQCSNDQRVRELLSSAKTAFYVGFDPTGSSLHAGHLIPLFAMAHLQQAGHRAIALVGGGTARIGDPSGKTETRRMLSVGTIRANAVRFRHQISRFISFGEDEGVMIDNADWLSRLNHIEFLRDIGKHFSVNRMLTFETYKMRLETGLSFIEFNYQILQSYDFLVLFRQYACMIQLGGDDQWGNIVSGIELIRRIEGVETFGITSPLVTRADGKKMGKTEKGALYLDPDLVSPYEFYQYWMNVPDANVGQLLLLLTFLPTEEAKELGRLRGSDINRAKEILAFELTSIVHGKREADGARDAAQAVFKRDRSADSEAMPTIRVATRELRDGIGVVEIFTRTDLCSSRSEARRLIAQGGAYINDENVRDVEAVVTEGMIGEGSLMLRAGKKRHFRVLVEP